MTRLQVEAHVSGYRDETPASAWIIIVLVGIVAAGVLALGAGVIG